MPDTRFHSSATLPSPGLRRGTPTACLTPTLPCPPEQDGPARLPSGFEPLGVVGQGALGVVYRARPAGGRRVVALKVPRAGALACDRLRAEGEALARLRHRHVVRLWARGEEEGVPYLALELAEGDLADHLACEGPLAPADAARLVEALARGVAHAHARGVLHRDLKPGNVLLGAVGNALRGVPARPRLADFGLAVLGDGGRWRVRADDLAGTPAYMAPEQALGARRLGPEADVYGLGAVLYEALTGRPPFVASSAVALLRRVLEEAPADVRAWAPGVPAELEAICLRCLNKAPRQRFASARALADALRRFSGGARARTATRPGAL